MPGIQELRRVRDIGDAFKQTRLELDAIRRARTEWYGQSTAVRELAVTVAELVIAQKERAAVLEELVEDLDDARTNNERRLEFLQETLRTSQEYQTQVDAAVETSAGFTTQVQTIVRDQDVIGTAVREAIAERDPVIRDVIVDVVRDELDIPEETTVPGETTMFTQTVQSLLTPEEVTRRVNAAVTELVARRQSEINARVNASIRRAVAAQVVIPDDPDVSATVATIAASAATTRFNSAAQTLRNRHQGWLSGIRTGRTNHLSGQRTTQLAYLNSFFVNLQGTGLTQKWTRIYTQGDEDLAVYFGNVRMFIENYNNVLAEFARLALAINVIVPEYQAIERTGIFYQNDGLRNNLGRVIVGSLLVNVTPRVSVLSVIALFVAVAGVFAAVFTLGSAGLVSTSLFPGAGMGFSVTFGTITSFGSGITGPVATLNIGISLTSALITTNTLSAIGAAAAASAVATTISTVSGIAEAFGTGNQQRANAELRSLYGTDNPSEILAQAETRGFVLGVVTAVGAQEGILPTIEQVRPFRLFGLSDSSQQIPAN